MIIGARPSLCPTAEFRFTVLSLCAWMLRSIRPQSRWTSRVKDLFADYPEVPLSAMGFPVDWQKFALWK